MTVRNRQIEANREPPVFAAQLWPHRSLSLAGFRWLMAVVLFWFLPAGIVFVAMGAWPVLGYMAAAAFLVWAAFRLNYRAGLAREEVTIWPHDLRLRQISPSGRIREHNFNPLWTRFFVDRHDEIGITAMRLRSEGREIAFGACLNPADRESFAAAFARALAGVKGSNFPEPN